MLPAEAQGAEFLGIAFAGSEALVPFVKQVNAERGIYLGGILANNGGWLARGHRSCVAAAVDRFRACRDRRPGRRRRSLRHFLGIGRAAADIRARRSGQLLAADARAAAGPARRLARAVPGRRGAAGIVTGSGARLVNTVSESAVPPGIPGQPPGTDRAGWRSGRRCAPTSDGCGLERRATRSQRRRGTAGELRIPGPAVHARSGAGDARRPRRGQTAGLSVGNPGKKARGRLSRAKKRSSPRTWSDTAKQAARPTASSAAEVPTHGWATFAIGGDAECVDPCAERSLAGVGPHVWLESAVSLRSGSRARAFIYTGPNVTEGRRRGAIALCRSRFSAEFERTGQILASGV